MPFWAGVRSAMLRGAVAALLSPAHRARESDSLKVRWASRQLARVSNVASRRLSLSALRSLLIRSLQRLVHQESRAHVKPYRGHHLRFDLSPRARRPRGSYDILAP